jgi:hypothetical protein
MRSKLFIAFLSVAFIATSCGSKKTGGPETPTTSDEIELKLNLTKGKKYDMRMTMQSNGEMNMMGQQVTTTTDMNMGMDYEVMDINPAGNFVVRSTYRSIKMSGETMGMKYEYDSETGKATGMQAEEMSKSMKKMIGQYTEMEMDKSGKIIKTTNSPGLDEGGKGKNKGGLENMNYTIFPDKKVKPGDTWESNIEQAMESMSIIVKSTYTLVAVKDGVAEISMDGTLALKEGSKGNLSGTQKGTSKIEVATGMSKEVTINQDLDMELDDMGMKMPMKLKNKVTITMN